MFFSLPILFSRFGYNNELVNEESDTVSCTSSSTLGRPISKAILPESFIVVATVEPEGKDQKTDDSAQGTKEYHLASFASQLMATLEPEVKAEVKAASRPKYTIKRSYSFPNLKINIWRDGREYLPWKKY